VIVRGPKACGLCDHERYDISLTRAEAESVACEDGSRYLTAIQEQLAVALGTRKPKKARKG